MVQKLHTFGAIVMGSGDELVKMLSVTRLPRLKTLILSDLDLSCDVFERHMDRLFKV